MNHEEAYAEEAQEAVLEREYRENRATQKDPSHIRISEDASENESRPLMRDFEPIGGPRLGHRRHHSYERAINEPWTGAHGAGNRPWYKRPSVYWLLPASFPLCIAFGGIIVPKTYLIQDLICRDVLSDRSMKNPSFSFAPIHPGGGNSQCDDDNEVQQRTALFSLWISLISGVFSAIVSPHLGSLSDRIGRKPVIVCATFGAFVGEFITIIVGSNPDKFSVNWLMVGYLADGLCGSFTASMALCFAYASDCTAPERRNVAFGRFHANLFAGIALGPILAGVLINAFGIMAPFYFALACHVFFIIFTSLCVPESLSKERQLVARERYEMERALSPGFRLKDLNILKPLSILRPKGPGSSKILRRNLFVLAAIDTMMFGVAMGAMQITLIYSRKRFHWDAVASSTFLSAVNICRVSALLLILPLLTRWVRGPPQQRSDGHRGADRLDLGLIRVSILFDLLGYMGFAFTPSGAIMILSGMIASFGGIGPPTLQSAMTKHIPANRTGQILGASGLLHALAKVVSPIIFNLIYRETVATFAGFVFLCLGSVFIIVFIMSWFIKPGVYFDEGKGDSNIREETESLMEEH